MTWNYRIVRQKGNDRLEPGQFFYGIHEAYYDRAGQCYAITAEPVAPFGESAQELRQTLLMMKMDATKRPVLDYETRKDLPADA